MNNSIDATSKNLSSAFCLICGGSPDVIGVFVPQDPEVWGSIQGKGRIFRYCLCSKCHSRPDTPEQVEKIIRAELVGGGVNRAS